MTIVLLLLAIIVFLLLVQYTIKLKNYPPGPVSWPFVGNLFVLRRKAKKYGGQHLALLELSRRYDSDIISFRQGRNRIIAVSGTKGVSAVLQGEKFDGRPWDEFIKLRNFGIRKGITMNDGENWKNIRHWFVQTFRSVGFGRRKMSELIKDELLHVLDSFKEGDVIRIRTVFAPVVLNVIWTLTAGKRFSDDSRMQYFMKLMERRAGAFDMTGGVLAIFPWIRHLAPEMSGYNLIATLNNELKCFLMDTINQSKELYVSGSECTLVDCFFKEMYSGKGSDAGFDAEQLTLILLDLFLAGSSTTLLTLDFALLNMVIHQDIQRRIQQELDNVINPHNLPDIEDRLRLPYVKAVLTESQRMWCVTPIIGPRRVLRDTELLGYSIPKETTIILNIYSLNNDPKLFPEPRTFKPERFIKDGCFQTDENLILFGKGRRRCPGEILAKTALFLLFTGILQRYELHPVPGQYPTKVSFVPGLTISPEPYEVLLVRRNNTGT